MEARARLFKIAVSQHGLVTADQARRAGLGAHQITWLTRSGEWRSIRPGVYARAGVPPTWDQSIAAAVLASGPSAWASHATAAALWTMSGANADEIEVVAPLDRRGGLAGVRGHRSSALFTADLTQYRRIPVTTPERTLVDLSGRLAPAPLGSMLDDALRRRLVRLDRMRTCVARLAGSPGRRPAVVQSLLAQRLPGYDPGDSDIETRALRLLVAHGFPPPVQQYRVHIGGRTFRIDLAYPWWRLAIELDGWEHHRTRSAFDDDRYRANLLVANGWMLLRFTSRSSDAQILDAVGAARDRFGRSGAA